MNKKVIATVGACALCLGLGVAGTLAWLTDETGPVVNTFTDSDINISLAETTGEHYKMVPGYTIDKDPKVTVEAGSEDCFLFVKVEKSNNFDSFMTYKIADGWNELNGVDNVYYQEITSEQMGTQISVLKDDCVIVKNEVTKNEMNSLSENNYPTLKVTAYATQLFSTNNKKFSATDAWAKVSS